MLKRLFIQNYAIIEEIAIDFSPQLNIITGETGAGKSILMGALNLILGERADSAVLVNAEKKCFIEGIFSVTNKESVKAFLQANDLDQDDELVLRREISTNGKSRAFINDTPATLQQMKILASLLVDLHQQFDTLALGDTEFQREVLDALAGNEQALKTYQKIFTQWQATEKELHQLYEQKNTAQKELDYHQFLFTELSEHSFREDELENLDQELKTLSNAEGIKTTLNKVYFDLKESETPIVQLLKILVQQLQGYADYHTDLPNIINRLSSAQIELQDIAEELDRINNTVQHDEQRIEFINQRLMQGYKLLKKHGVQTTNQLLAIQNDLEQKLQAVLDMSDLIAAKEKQLAELYATAKSNAEKISKKRIEQASPLEEKVNKLLAQVGMPNARLKVIIKPAELSAAGQDQIDFLFDANKSNRFEPIRKVASGGELSRLMLCIKSLVAQSVDLPTMIFDEIDTGISGEAAKQVGFIMKDLSTNRQIICITHQPQIAGKANAHFFVYKDSSEEVIKTNIRRLSDEERITTIASMLSGEKPTAAALENAREMIMH